MTPLASAGGTEDVSFSTMAEIKAKIMLHAAEARRELLGSLLLEHLRDGQTSGVRRMSTFG